MPETTWRIVISKSLPNLNVMEIDSIEVGFIYRNNPTRTTQDAWKIFIGTGPSARFIGHAWDKKSAKYLLEGSING